LGNSLRHYRNPYYFRDKSLREDSQRGDFSKMTLQKKCSEIISKFKSSSDLRDFHAWLLEKYPNSKERDELLAHCLIDMRSAIQKVKLRT